MVKIYIAGPLDPTFSAHLTMKRILNNLEQHPEVDLYLRPTSISIAKYPLTPFMAHLLTKQPIAPFDVGLVVHDISNMHTSRELRESSRLLVAYVTQAPDRIPERLTLKARLRPFDLIVPDTALTKRSLTGYTGKTMVPKSTTTFVDSITPGNVR